MERTMREFLVQILVSQVESHPYVFGSLLVFGALTLARALLHEIWMFIVRLTNEVRASKAELHELSDGLGELKRELTTWKADDGKNSKERQERSEPGESDTPSDHGREVPGRLVFRRL